MSALPNRKLDADSDADSDAELGRMMAIIFILIVVPAALAWGTP
jgi:hypothetical protein